MTTGTSLVINVKDLNVNWEAGKSYRIEVNTGLTKEVGNNRSPSEPRTLEVTVTTASVVGSVPAYNASGVTTSSYSLNFDRYLYKGDETASFKLYQGVNTGTGVLISEIPSTSAKFSTLDNSIVLDLKGDVDRQRDYFITLDRGVVTDIFNLASNEILDESVWKWSTGNGPSITGTSPAYNTTNSFITTVSLNYGENVSFNNANKKLYLYEIVNGSPVLVQELLLSDTRIEINENQLILDLSGIVDGNGTYFIASDEGVASSDYNGFSSEPITDDSVFKYSTGPGPRFFNFTPPNLTVASSATFLRFIFDKPNVTKNTGNLYVKDSGGTTVGEIPVAGDRITLQSLVAPPQTWLNIDVKGIVDTNETYYITSDFGTFKDTIPFSYDGSINSSTWKYSIGDVGPKLTSTTPATSSTNIGVSIISWNYSRNTFPPKTSDRKFYVYKDGALHSSYTLGESILSYSTTTNSVQLNLTAVNPDNKAFWTGGSTYHILADKGAVRDVNFWSADAISSSTQFRFTTAPKPVVTATSVIYSGTTILSEIEFDRNVDVDYFTLNTSTYIRLNKVGESLVFNDFGYPGLPFYGVSSGGITKVSGKKFRIDLKVRPSLSPAMTKGSTFYWSSDIFASGDPDRMSQEPFGQSAATTFTLTGATLVSTNVVYDSYITTGTLRLSYDRTIASLSTGSYYLYEGTSDPGTIAQTITSSSSIISTSSNVASFNLVGVIEKDKTYWITNDEGTFLDQLLFTNNSILDSSKIKFKTSGPLLQSATNLQTPTNFVETYYYLSRLNSFTNLNPAKVEFNYDRTISVGTGNYFIRNSSDNSLIQTISSTSTNVINSGTKTTVNFNNLPLQEKYYITYDGNVIKQPIFDFPVDQLSSTDTCVLNLGAVIKYQHDFTSDFRNPVGQKVATDSDVMCIAGNGWLHVVPLFGTNQTSRIVYVDIPSGDIASLAIKNDTILVGFVDGPVYTYDYTGYNPSIPSTFPGYSLISQSSLSAEIGSVGISELGKIMVSYISYDISRPIRLWDNATIGNTPYEIYNPNHHNNCKFGISAQIDDSNIIIGASGQNGSVSNTGKAFVYNIDRTLAYLIENPNQGIGDQFGADLDFNSSYIAVGAPGVAGKGSVYIFNRADGSLFRTFAFANSNNTNFGFKVRMMKDYILIGDSKSIYLYRLSDGKLIQTQSGGSINSSSIYSINSINTINVFIKGDPNWLLNNNPQSTNKGYISRYQLD